MRRMRLGIGVMAALMIMLVGNSSVQRVGGPGRREGSYGIGEKV